MIISKVRHNIKGVPKQRKLQFLDKSRNAEPLFKMKIDLTQKIERKLEKTFFDSFKFNFHDACHNFYISDI